MSGGKIRSTKWLWAARSIQKIRYICAILHNNLKKEKYFTYVGSRLYYKSTKVEIIPI